LARLPGVSVRTVATFAAAARALRDADVLVCPRSSWSGFPIKVLNYMATGRPIVQARGSAHALEDGVSGLLFDDDDPGALAKALLRVLRDPRLAERLGEGARETLRRQYLWPRVLPAVIDVYARVSAGRGAGKKIETKKADGAGMGSVPEHVAHQRTLATLARLGARRAATALRTAVILLTVLAMGCARRPPDTIAPLPPISAAVVPGAAAQSSNYKIGVGDHLRVKFAYHPELDTKVPVGPDGNIQIVGVGELAAAGKTSEGLAADIEELSSETLRDPEVTVIVAELGERVVYVMGEVRLPGKVVYREGMTPLEAIADRGGFTEVAQLNSVLHLSPDGNTYVADRLDFTRDVDVQGPELAKLEVYDVIVVPRTYIGDANAVMRLYVRGLLPTMPRIGIGFSP
jgi:polysaccharide export outer membrane protein